MAARTTPSTVAASGNAARREGEVMPPRYSAFPSGTTSTTFASDTPSSFRMTIRSAKSRWRMIW